MIKNILISILPYMFLVIIALLIFGFIYNYSHDSNTVQDNCVPDYMTGDCSF